MNLPRLTVAFLAWAMLLAGLTLPTFAPEISNTAILVLMSIALLHLIWVPERRQLLRQPAGWMPLLAGLFLFIAFSLTAKSPLHVAAFLALVHLYMVVPMAGLLTRLGDALTLDRIGLFALAGTAGGAIAAAIDIFVLGSARAGLVNNPIHLAALGLALGFVSLIGIWGTGRLRAIFLLGPVLGIVTVYLTGSRGPTVAAAQMLLVAAAAICFSWLPARTARRVVGSSIAILACIVIFFLVTGVADELTPTGQILSLLRTGVTSDTSTAERLVMYQSALNAFLASPLTGYGLLDYPAAAAAHAPPGVAFPVYAHLHNDIADFAVAGGLFGLLAYGLFLFAPLMGALRARGPLRIPLLYLGGVTTIGYFSMGMTNAVIGLRWQDIVLASVLALIVTLSTRSQGPQA